MNRRMFAVAGATAAMLAGCQPLPHPFADDRPPAALLQVRDSISVAVAPVAGDPKPAATKLPDLVARALLKHDIPASDKTTSLDSYQLYGRLAEKRGKHGKASLVAVWRLDDAKGRKIGERTVELPLPPKKGKAPRESDKLLDQLAETSADRLAGLLVDEAPAEKPAKAAAEPRIAVGKITGAPGDGAAALAKAVAGVLRNQHYEIVAAGKKPDLLIDCVIALTSAGANKQHIKIVWHVRRAKGGEVGTVGQENDIPKGSLDHAWGDLAYTIAMAAADGLAQVVARAESPPKS